MELSAQLLAHYEQNQEDIRLRLAEFKRVQPSEYFYELCYCICTPQSKAVAAFQVQNKLKAADFYNHPFDPVDILLHKEHYIRFHNQKSERLLMIREQFPQVMSIIESSTTPQVKRLELNALITGMGMKECSHYLRNIGFSGLTILDRHILKHLVIANVYQELPKISSVKQYLSVEEKFLEFAGMISIPIDEMDLLFWSFENGNILK